MNNIERLKTALNELDYEPIVEILEDIILADDAEETINDTEFRGSGWWQETYNLLPNVLPCRMIAQFEKTEPIASGKYWIVVNAKDITDIAFDLLEELGLWEIDYISQSDYDKIYNSKEIETRYNNKKEERDGCKTIQFTI